MEERNMIHRLQASAPARPILVVDRDSMSSHVLAEMLSRDPRYDAAALLPTELVPRLNSNRASLLVISEDLPSKPRRGLELAATAYRANPEILIVIMLDHSGPESVVAAFRAGARGVFSRRQSFSEFLDCVEDVNQGRLWVGKHEADYLLEALRRIPAPNASLCTNSAPLTRRELEVIQCAAQGKTNKIIANELNLSEHTIKNYLFRAFEKLGVSSRIELLFHLTTSGHHFSPISEERSRPVTNRVAILGPGAEDN